ncbi:MAG: glycosyltransferase, partial [Clostridia bacterium]|nr:glycosyltransferase [Clostridia bacterium]
ENIMSSSQIRTLAAVGDTFTDTDFAGKRILTVGRISNQKGLDLIPAVLKQLHEDNFNVRWYILGDGDIGYRQSVEKQLDDLGIADMMVFLGATQNPYRYIADCDIYAQPSRHEGKPIAVEEAKILCKPILTSRYLSANEQLEGGTLGVICDTSSSAIYEGIKTLLTDQNLCTAFRDTLASRDFSNRAEIEKFYEMIQ